MSDPNIVGQLSVEMTSHLEDTGEPEKELFWGPRQKVARARFLIDEFERRVVEHFKQHPPERRFEHEMREGFSMGHLNIYVGARPLPAETGVLVGDAIHNLRAALDLAANDVVRAQGQNTRGVYFPFCKDAASLPKAIKDKKFDRAGQPAVDLLTTIAPYAGGNDVLRALHDLDIDDKHRALAPATTVTTAGLTVSPPGVDGSIRFQAAPNPVVVVFPEGLALGGQAIVPSLVIMADTVASIVEAFAGISPTSPP